MKKSALAIVFFVLFAAAAFAAVPEILPIDPALYKEASTAKGPQPSDTLQEALEEQKARGSEPVLDLALEPEAKLSPEEPLQQLALVPQFIEPATKSGSEKSVDVEEPVEGPGAENGEIAEEDFIPDPLE
ncbi:MAG: hypothetical protein WAV13_11390, partial [Thermodesulfovibrionales bacterium]